MKHRIEMTTIESLAVLRALREYSERKRTPFDDVILAKNVMDTINKTVPKDLKENEK